MDMPLKLCQIPGVTERPIIITVQGGVSENRVETSKTLGGLQSRESEMFANRQIRSRWATVKGPRRFLPVTVFTAKAPLAFKAGA